MVWFDGNNPMPGDRPANYVPNTGAPATPAYTQPLNQTPTTIQPNQNIGPSIASIYGYNQYGQGNPAQPGTGQAPPNTPPAGQPSLGYRPQFNPFNVQAFAQRMQMAQGRPAPALPQGTFQPQAPSAAPTQAQGIAGLPSAQGGPYA